MAHRGGLGSKPQLLSWWGGGAGAQGSGRNRGDSALFLQDRPQNMQPALGVPSPQHTFPRDNHHRSLNPNRRCQPPREFLNFEDLSQFKDPAK